MIFRERFVDILDADIWTHFRDINLGTLGMEDISLWNFERWSPVKKRQLKAICSRPVNERNQTLYKHSCRQRRVMNSFVKVTTQHSWRWCPVFLVRVFHIVSPFPSPPPPSRSPAILVHPCPSSLISCRIGTRVQWPCTWATRDCGYKDGSRSLLKLHHLGWLISVGGLTGGKGWTWVDESMNGWLTVVRNLFYSDEMNDLFF